VAIPSVLAVVWQGGFQTIRREMELAFGRLRAGTWPVVWTAVVASVAWSRAVLTLGREQPFVAAIAAVITVVRWPGRC
jgi:hypothetical protein